MGFLSGILGKPKKPPPSAAEIANAEIGKKQWDYYKHGGFIDLEQGLLDESNRDFTDTQQARGNADVFQSTEAVGTKAMQANLMAGSGGTKGNPLAELSVNTAEAGMGTDQGAATSAKQNMNQRMNAAAGFGVGLSGQAIAGNSDLNAMQTNESIARMQRKSSEALAKVAAVAKVASAGAMKAKQGADAKAFDQKLAQTNDSYYKATRWASHTPVTRIWG